MIFYGIVTLATAMLNARRRFAAAAFAPMLNNLVVIASSSSLPHVADGDLTVRSVADDPSLIVLMGLGTTAGIVVMALALLPALHRAGVRLRFLPALRHAAVRTMLRLSGWTVGYVIANQIALLVVTILANGTAGGPFVYVSAYAFFQLPHGLFAVSFMTTFAPELASAASRGDLDHPARAALAGHAPHDRRDRARGRAVPRARAARSSSRCSNVARSTPPTRSTWPTRSRRSPPDCSRSRSTSSRCAPSRRASTPSRPSG